MDRDALLAISYAPADRRNSLSALWRLDAALGAVLSGREPMISRIKLAWWREALEALDGNPAPPEPILRDVEIHVVSRGIRGTALAALANGWEYLLEPELSSPLLVHYAAGRGGRLFATAAQLLGAEAADDVMAAGEAWALFDLARHSSRAAEADQAVALAGERLGAPDRPWPDALRPLAMLRLLARRDSRRGAAALEPAGSPARMLRLLRYRLTGR